MKKKTTLYSVLSGVSAAVFLFSSVMAYGEWKVQNDTINVITMASVKSNIVEEYEQNTVVYPDSKVTKIVQVENIGTIDVFTRVKITKVWGDSREEDGTLNINPDLSTDNILITYNLENWKYCEEDGYYYYRHALAPGEISKSLFDSFTIDEKTTGNAYRNKCADIIVDLEVIQAGETVLDYWGTSREELGIVYQEEERIELVTRVDFNGPEEGFSFDINSGDLFADFKNLIPGEVRGQIIEITNKWDDSVNIYFWADYVDQEYVDERTKVLIDQLLREYAIIQITDDAGNVIYHGPIWGNLDVDADGMSSMKHPFHLGYFNSQDVKRIHVSLTLDPNMDNEQLALLGLIKWVFSAQGDTSTSDDPPEETTGETEDTNKETETTQPISSDDQTSDEWLTEPTETTAVPPEIPGSTETTTVTAPEKTATTAPEGSETTASDDSGTTVPDASETTASDDSRTTASYVTSSRGSKTTSRTSTTSTTSSRSSESNNVTKSDYPSSPKTGDPTKIELYAALAATALFALLMIQRKSRKESEN